MEMPEISEIELSFNGMERGKTCTVSKIKVNQNQVPVGSKQLSLILEDIDIGLDLTMPHGVHCYEFNNTDVVLEKKFKIMPPLTPPKGKSHRYKLTVRALDKEHHLLGIGTVVQKFP